MFKTKYLLLLVIAITLLTACGTSPTPATSTVADQNTPSPVSTLVPSDNSTNPYPIVTPTQASVNSAYPNPGASGSTPDYFVNQLVIPTPSQGLGVITGQLLVGGDANKPYFTTLYLASTTPASDASQPPVINFSIQTDPIATEEISSGRFMFADVAPGKYALVASSGAESFFLVDSTGHTLFVDVKENETTDLGVLPIK